MSKKRIPFVIAVSPILSGFVENKNVDFMRSSRRIKRCKCQRKKNDGFLYTLGNSGVQAVDGAGALRPVAAAVILGV